MSTNAPIIKNPVTLDAVIGEIQKGLADNLLWLDAAFGRAQRLVKMQDGKRYLTPNVYCGGWNGHGENDYIEVSPDSHIGNFAFFEVDDPQTITPGPWPREIKAPFSLVVWFDLRTIYEEKDNRNTEQIKDDILHVLNGRAGWHLKGGRVVINKVYERADNIYRGYTLPETDNQYLMHPYAGFRFEGLLEFDELCYPITPTPPEEKGLLRDREDAAVKTREGKKVRVGVDDYTSRYSGSVMDRKFDAIGLHVVAGRRIPKSNFGPVGTVRYGYTPTFSFSRDELDTVVYAPVMVDLIRAGIINPMEGLEIVDDTHVRSSLETSVCEFTLLLRDIGCNAIKKTADGYKAIRITSCKTTSPYLEIQNGHIACVKPAVVLPLPGSPLEGIHFTTYVDCLMEYKRSGKHPRVHGRKGGGDNNCKRKKWLFVSYRKVTPSETVEIKRRVLSPGIHTYFNGILDGTIHVGGTYFRSKSKHKIKIRLRPIHRYRWRSCFYAEFEKIIRLA